MFWRGKAMTQEAESALVDITAGWMLAHIFDIYIRDWPGYFIRRRLTPDRADMGLLTK